MPGRLVVVTGPTASGKTAYSLDLADALGAEIVSADSMQVYRRLDVGTAKPTSAERRRVRHHLIDVVEPDEAYHAARFRLDAATAIEEIRSRGRVPVIAGGTALYLKALLQGLAPCPGRDEPTRGELEAEWSAGRAGALWAELRQADPRLAARLHPNDRTRIVRGLEVWRLTGQPLSAYQERHAFQEEPYEALLLGMSVEKPELHRRIRERTDAMLEAGWIEEVRSLLSDGYSPDLPALQAVGYREVCRFLRSGGDLDRLRSEIAASTRRLAKRQSTWFRRMPIRWVAPEDLASGLALVKKFLQRSIQPI